MVVEGHPIYPSSERHRVAEIQLSIMHWRRCNSIMVDPLFIGMLFLKGIMVMQIMTLSNVWNVNDMGLCPKLEKTRQWTTIIMLIITHLSILSSYHWLCLFTKGRGYFDYTLTHATGITCLLLPCFVLGSRFLLQGACGHSFHLSLWL